jgi:hypothetical protein
MKYSEYFVKAWEVAWYLLALPKSYSRNFLTFELQSSQKHASRLSRAASVQFESLHFLFPISKVNYNINAMFTPVLNQFNRWDLFSSCVIEITVTCPYPNLSTGLHLLCCTVTILSIPGRLSPPSANRRQRQLLHKAQCY